MESRKKVTTTGKLKSGKVVKKVVKQQKEIVVNNGNDFNRKYKHLIENNEDYKEALGIYDDDIEDLDLYDDDLYEHMLGDDTSSVRVDFEHSCGATEIGGISSWLEPQSPQMVIDFFRAFLAEESKAAVIFTDTARSTHGGLWKQIVEPIPLGRNPNTGNNLLMWVITRNHVGLKK